jgi:hypothetical protein
VPAGAAAAGVGISSPADVTTRFFRPTLGDLLGIQILFLVVVAGGLRLFGDGDAATHVATGRWILAHHAVPRVDPFAAPGAAGEWFAHEWLAAVGMAVVHDALGWPGIAWIAALLIATAHVLLYRHLIRRGDDALVALVAVEIAALAASAHWLARPHLVTALLLVIWTMLLEDVVAGRRGAAWLAALPPLAALWANLHGGFLVGLAVLIFYIGGLAVATRRGDGATRARRLLPRVALAALVSAAATLANPRGWHLHAHLIGFFLHRGPALAHTSEFEPANFGDRAGLALLALFVATAAAVALGLVARSAGPPPFHPATLVACAATGLMAVRTIRDVEIAAVFGALLISGGLSRWLAARARPGSSGPLDALRRHEAGAGGGLFACALALTGVLAVTGPFPSTGFDPAHFPVAAVERLRQSGVVPDGPVLVPDFWGGYVTLNWPGAVAYVDGRWDMRGDAAFERYATIMAARPSWDRLLSDAGIRWALLPPDVPLAAALGSDRGWRLVSADPSALAFRRIEAGEP